MNKKHLHRRRYGKIIMEEKENKGRDLKQDAEWNYQILYKNERVR